MICSFLLIYSKGSWGVQESNLASSFNPDIYLHLPCRNLTLSEISVSLVDLVKINWLFQKLLEDGSRVLNCKNKDREKSSAIAFLFY